MSISLPDGVQDIKLTDAERELCDANIETVSVSGSVSVNFETFKFEFGGSVPAGLEPSKFTKHLINSVNWFRQSARIQMSNGVSTGVAMRQAKEN